MATTGKEITPTHAAAPQANDAVPDTARRSAAIITLAIICVAVFLTALDQLVVATALIPIAVSFKLDFTVDTPSIAWIISGYLLGFVIVMPLMGRVSDLWGRRRVLIASLVLFGIGSLICAASVDLGTLFDLGFLGNIGIHSPAPALTWLVIARFVQAVGGGAVVPVAIAAIGDLFGDRRRILALGLIGGVTEAGGALGPLYGAFIIQKWPFLPTGFDTTFQDTSVHIGDYSQPWQWIFLLNLPIVALIVIALLVLWPRQPAVAATIATRRRSLDLPGALLLGGSLLCVSLGLGQEAGAISSLRQAHVVQNNVLLLVAALVLLGLFVVVENFQRDPVIPLSIFRSSAFSASALFSLLLGMALIIALVDVPFFVFAVYGTDHYIDAGLALLRMTIMIPLGAFGGGWLVTRSGTRIVGLAGAACTALGFFLMHLWSAHTGWGDITVGTVIAGLGFGLIVAPISTTALNATKASYFGVAASVVTALRMIGMMLGLAALSSWGVGRFQDLERQIPPIKDITNAQQLNAFNQAVTDVTVHIVTDFFLVGAVLALIAVIPALFLWRAKAGEQPEQASVAVLPLA